MKKLRSGEGCSRPGAQMRGQDGEAPRALAPFQEGGITGLSEAAAEWNWATAN